MLIYENKNRELNSCESLLKPRNKKHEKQYENYIKNLKLVTEGEKFILLCVLNFDWRRRKILSFIEYIKEDQVTNSIKFRINMTAPSKTTDYSISSPFPEFGWTDEYQGLSERMFYVYHQMDRYTS